MWPSSLATAMRSVLEGIRDGGVASKTFVDAYDKQQTLLALDPAVDMNWPPYLVWSRHRAFITDNIDIERWIRLVSSSTLSAMIDKSELKAEQSTLVAERIAGAVKGTLGDQQTETNTSLGQAFHLDRQWDLQPEVQSFAEALSVFIHRDSLTDLDDYIDLMTVAEEALNQNVPQRGNNGSCVGRALIGFPRCKALYSSGKLALQQARVSQAKIQPQQDNIF